MATVFTIHWLSVSRPPAVDRWRQRWLQYLTCSQSRRHFFRHVNGRPQVAQILVGKLGLLWAISVTVNQGQFSRC